MKRHITYALWMALLLSNAAWYRAYHKLDLGDMQANALLDWSNDLLKGKIYQVTEQHNSYEAGITCKNQGDPTVVGNFDGMLIVSCGEGQ